MNLLNKSFFPVLLIAIIALIVWRNTKHLVVPKPEIKDRLEYAMQLAGNNRIVLETVLTHYKNDSLKFKAANFLIENMDNCYNEIWVTRNVKGDDVNIPFKDFRTGKELFHYMDSLHLGFQMKTRIYDAEVITANFLINNIEKAFELWKRPFANQLEFKEFCEFILPYRVDREALEDFRSYLSRKYDILFKAAKKTKSLLAAGILINSQLLKDVRWRSIMTLYPGRFTAKVMDSLGIGDCQHLANYGIQAFRSLGIPIANDFVTAWGDTDGNHSWTVLIGKNLKMPFIACDVNPGEFSFIYKAPKIYRKTFGRQPDALRSFKRLEQEIPAELDDAFRIDVTNEYYKTLTVSIPLDIAPPKHNNCAFLCVYNNNQWLPVDWGKINPRRDSVEFKNISDSLLYCAMYYNHKQLVPVNSPFFLADKTNLKWFGNATNQFIDCNIQYNKVRITQTSVPLFIWNGKWEQYAVFKICQEKDRKSENCDRKFFVELKGIPENGLFRLGIYSRPFWIYAGKICRSEQNRPLGISQLNIASNN